MDPAIIVAIIGAAATVVAAFISVKKSQTEFRAESNHQHGVLSDLVRSVAAQTEIIYDDLQDVRGAVKDHLASHENADAKSSVAKKRAAKKVG